MSSPVGAWSQFSLEADLRYGFGTRLETTAESGLQLEPGYDAKLADDLWFLGSARFRFDPADELEPGRPAYDTYAGISQPRVMGESGTGELRDLYLEWLLGDHLFRIGKQQVVWGTLDGIRVLDSVNPHSFREFILADFDESRINLWSLYGDLSLGEWRLEVLWSPDTTVHDVPEPGAWFELTAPRFRFGATGSDHALTVITQRSDDLSDGTIGARASRRLGRTTLRLQAQTGLDYEPLGRVLVMAGEPVLERYYERRTLYGMSLETALAGMVIRGELAVQPDRFFATRSGDFPDAVEADQWTAAIGLDMDGPLGTFVNVQLLHDRISGARIAPVRNDEDTIVTIFLRRTFAYESWRLESRWYGNLKDDDGLARLAIIHDLSESLSLELAGDYFYGSETGIFGQFREKDRITLRLQFRL